MPLISEVHVDQALSNLSLSYKNGGYQAGNVLMVIPTDGKESNKFFKYTIRNNFQLPDNALRAPKTPARRVEFGLGTGSFQCEEYALKDLISDRERSNSDPALNLDADTTEVLTDMILNLLEKRGTDLFLATANVTQNTTLSGTSQWSDFANSDPFKDIRTAKTTIHKATGKGDNLHMVVGRPVHDKLIDHPDILERFKYTQAAVMSEQILARVFEVDSYSVAQAIKDTANEGQTASLDYIWGKDVLTFHKPPRVGLRLPAFGALFTCRDFRVKRYRDEELESDVIEVSHVVDELLLEEKLGYLIKAAVA